MIDRLLAHWWSRPDPALDIRPPVVLHEGFAPELRERTLAKRKREDAAKRAAARIASAPAPSEADRRLRVIGGER